MQFPCTHLFYFCSEKQKSKNMQTYYLDSDLKINKNLKTGFITLVGRDGHTYRTPALYVPGYCWVPCSRRLCANPTTNPAELILVVSEPSDEYIPYTSDIWITRVKVKATFEEVEL